MGWRQQFCTDHVSEQTPLGLATVRPQIVTELRMVVQGAAAVFDQRRKAVLLSCGPRPLQRLARVHNVAGVASCALTAPGPLARLGAPSEARWCVEVCR